MLFWLLSSLWDCQTTNEDVTLPFLYGLNKREMTRQLVSFGGAATYGRSQARSFPLFPVFLPSYANWLLAAALHLVDRHERGINLRYLKPKCQNIPLKASLPTPCSAAEFSVWVALESMKTWVTCNCKKIQKICHSRSSSQSQPSCKRAAIQCPVEVPLVLHSLSFKYCLCIRSAFIFSLSSGCALVKPEGL